MADNTDPSVPRSSLEDCGHLEKAAGHSSASTARSSVPAVQEEEQGSSSSAAEEANTPIIQERKPEASCDVAERSETQIVQDQASEWKVGRQEALIMMALVIISLTAALDATVLVPVLPTISAAIPGSATDAFWAGTSYLLACVVFQPFIASLSDIFGRRQLLTLSILIFTIGTLICCLSHDFTELLTGRTVQGVGGGGIIALTMVIFSDIIPLRQRPRYWTLIQLTWAFGTIAGPLVGGLFAQHASWRWVFIINFPFCALGLITVPLVVRLKTRRSSIKEKILRVDWFGGFIFVASFTSFLVGLTWGGVQFPWSSFRTLIPLILGTVGIGATFVWEMWGAEHAFVRLSIFDSFSTVAIYLGAMMQGLLLFGMLYYLPIYLEAVKNLSPTVTGTGLLGITCGLFPSSTLVGIVVSRTGHFRWAIWTGWVITTLGTGLLLLFGVHTTRAIWVGVFFIIGSGHGFLVSALGISAQAATNSGNVSYAIAMYSFMRTIGMVIGVATGGSIFQNRLPQYLEEANIPLDKALEISKNADAFVTVLRQMPMSTSSRQEIVSAYARALRVIFGVLTGISSLGGVVSLAVRHHVMDKELDSEHVLR